MNGKLAMGVGVALAALGAALWFGFAGSAPTSATGNGASGVADPARSGAQQGSERGKSAAAGLGAAAEAPPARPALDCDRPDGAVATVDDQPLSAEKFCKELKQLGVAMAAGASAKSGAFAADLLERQIDVILVDAALAAEHTAVTTGEMEAELAPRGLHAVSAPVAPGAPEDLVELDLRRQGVDPDYLREQVRRRLALRKLLELRGDLNIPSSEVAAELQGHPERRLAGKAATVRAFVVRLPPNASDEQVAAAQQTATQFLDAARAGGETEAAPRLKVQAMPVFDLESPSSEPELEKAAFALQPQQWSAPVRTRTGVVVLQLVGLKAGKERTPSEVEAEIATQLQNRKRIVEQKRLVAALRAKAKIAILVDLPAPAARP